MNQPLRFAVIGSGRGKTFINAAQNLPGQAKLVALCDLNEASLDAWRDTHKIYTRYEDVLADPEIDAVCIATPVPLHARQAIDALRAGKHVLCEVTATYDIEEGLELIRTVNETGLTYMMAENYCFQRPVMCVQNMVEQGVFGDITYASGAYIHDCSELMYTSEGALTWRGQLGRTMYGNWYPTHSLGPVARWLDINRTDTFTSLVTMQSRNKALTQWQGSRFEGHPEYLENSFWAHGDTSTTLIKTEKGILAQIRVDSISRRPHQMSLYELQGTRASVSAPVDGHADWHFWMEGRSPADERGIATAWEPLSQYYEEFDHPLWREHLAEAQKSGHGGGDFFTLREFCNAIRENRKPIFDVVDAVTWSVVTPLSQKSIDAGGMPVAFPDFTLAQ